MIYDELGADYDRMINWEKRLERDLPLVLQLLDGAPGKKLVDMACGTGWYTTALRDAGWNSRGIDLSSTMIACAQERDPTGNFQQGSMLLPLAEQSDVIVCLGNSLAYIHNITDISLLATAWYESLVPGGYVLIQVVHLLPTEVKLLNGKEFSRTLAPTTGPFYTLTISRSSDKSVVAEDTLRCWSENDLMEELSKKGFTCQTFGSLNQEPLKNNSPDLVIRAVK